MNEKLKSNIDELADKSAKAERPDDAMKFAQAALSLAHVAMNVRDIWPKESG